MSEIVQNRVAVVTGGANGLGLSVASCFAVAGYSVCILDIDLAAAEKAAKDLQDQNYQVMAARVDTSNYESVNEAFDRCVEQFSRIDVLVCSAAIISVKPFLEVIPEDWDQTFAVNVKGLFFCNQKGGKVMRSNGGGRIINITSPASYLGLPFYCAYAASKAAVDSITRSAAIALAPDNIRVNCLAPGRMDTGMQEESERAWAQYAGVNYQAFVESRTDSLPLKRRATTQEVAQAVLFLAGEGSDYMTGSRLNITGGQELS